MTRLGYKVAIVTGGATDFSAQAAAVLAQNGATILLASPDETQGQQAAAALCAKGHRAEFHHLIPTDPLSWAALVDKTMRTHGHLDVLVNHSAASLSTTIEDATAPQLREMLEQGLAAPFLGMKAAIPAMRQSGGGSIINIAANPVIGALPLYPLYSAARAGLVSLTHSTALHCQQRGYDIRVNAIHPGAHESESLTEDALRSIKARNLHALLGTMPVRAEGKLYDFASTILHLADDESMELTGAELFCTGPLAGLDFPQS